MRMMGMEEGWVVVDVVRVIIVTLKFADVRAAVMGVPKLPEACGLIMYQQRHRNEDEECLTPKIATFVMAVMIAGSRILCSDPGT